MTTRILHNCKYEHGEDIDYDNPDYQKCMLWQRSCSSARPYIIDRAKGLIDARNALYIFERGDIPNNLKSTPRCSSYRCVNPYHCELVTEYEERRRKYAEAGFSIAHQISINVKDIDPDVIHRRVMNNIMLGFFMVEQGHTKKASIDDFKVGMEKFSRNLRSHGVKKAKTKRQRLRQSVQAFKVYCMASLDLNLQLC